MPNQIWEVLEGNPGRSKTGRAVNFLLIALILLNVIASILGTVKAIEEHYGTFLEVFEVLSVIIFTFEYFLRLIFCTSDSRFSGPVTGRLKFAVTPMALVDLASILPFYLPFVGLDLRLIRSLRLLRIFRILKLGRYSNALKLFGTVMRERKEELVITGCVTLILIVLSSSAMYYAEHGV